MKLSKENREDAVRAVAAEVLRTLKLRPREAENYFRSREMTRDEVLELVKDPLDPKEVFSTVSLLRETESYLNGLADALPSKEEVDRVYRLGEVAGFERGLEEASSLLTSAATAAFTRKDDREAYLLRRLSEEVSDAGRTKP